MSNLSELLPSGGGQNVVEFTASGAVASGKPVILNTNGTVTQVAETSVSESKGSVGTFDSNTNPTYAGYFGGYDTNVDVHFFGYQDTSDYYPKFKCLTLSGSTLSVASTTVLASNDNTGSQVICTFHPTTNLVVALTRQSSVNYAEAITIASSGSSITQGTRVNMSLGNEHEFFQAVYDEGSGYIVAISKYNNRPYLVAYKPSGTGSSATVTVGTQSQLYTDTVQYPTLYYDKSKNKIVAGYTDDNDGNDFYVHPVSVNSSTGALTIGTRQKLHPDGAGQCYMVYDEEAQRGIWGGRLLGSYFNMIAIKLNDDDSFTFGTPISDSSFTDSFNGTQATRINGTLKGTPLIYHPILKKTLFFYRTQTSSYTAVWPITCTDTTLTVGSISYLATQNYGRSQIGLSYDSDTNYIVIPSNRTNGGTEMLMQAYRPAYSETNLTATNFIGLASAAISDTATGDINVKGGINEAQTGLTIGSDYYVQDNGTLSTTTSTVKVGQAISATTINMMDLT